MQRRWAVLLAGGVLLAGLGGPRGAAGGESPQADTGVNWWVVAAGGGTTAAAGVVLDDTLGQPIVGLSSGGPVVLAEGYWDTDPYTAVILASFAAVPQRAGIVVCWETASEVDTAGFDLLRGETETGPYAAINHELIPAEGGPSRGARYAYHDAGVAHGVTYHYLLRAVGSTGQEMVYGPVSATAGGSHPAFLPVVRR